MYKYAKYNEEILGNKSIILSTASRPTPSIELFKTRFPVILYKNEWKNDGKNNELRNLFEYICYEEKIDLFYAIKGGENDGILPTNTRSAAHAVFRTDQPHGTVYAGICEYICKKFHNNHPFVYHIIEEEAPHRTNVYLGDNNVDIYTWLMLHYGCNLRLISRDDQLDFCFDNNYLNVKLKDDDKY